MTKEKQIEEMAKEIRVIKEYMYQSGGVIGEFRVGITHSERIAKHLIDNIGYSKASDVAREIIEILKSAGIDRYRYPIIAEIEKEYTEEGK